MAKRKFVSVSISGVRADGLHLAATADDGTAWLAEVPGGMFPKFDEITWVQLKELPETENSPVGLFPPKRLSE